MLLLLIFRMRQLCITEHIFCQVVIVLGGVLAFALSPTKTSLLLRPLGRFDRSVRLDRAAVDDALGIGDIARTEAGETPVLRDVDVAAAIGMLIAREARVHCLSPSDFARGAISRLDVCGRERTEGGEDSGSEDDLAQHSNLHIMMRPTFALCSGRGCPRKVRSESHSSRKAPDRSTTVIDCWFEKLQRSQACEPGCKVFG